MATLIRWEPLREISALQNEMSRFMNGLLEGNGRTNQNWVPALDVWEKEDEVVYALDLPGVPQDKISIEVEDGALTLSAQRERSQEVSEELYHRFERRYGTFSRTVGLPQGTSEESIKASYKDGVLEIHVPKPEQVKPKKIEIGVTGGDEGTKTIEGTATQK